MKETIFLKICKKHALIRALGITALLSVMLVSTASAEQTAINSITTNPNPPVYMYRGSGPVDELYSADFIITVHIANPPDDGYLVYSIGGMDFYSGYATIDNNGLATFHGSVHKGYLDGNLAFAEPSMLYLRVYDADGNTVASTEKFIKIYNSSSEIPEFPTFALPVVAALGIIAIVGHRKE